MYPAMAGYLHVFKDEPQLSLGQSLFLVLVVASIGGLLGGIIGWWLDSRKKSK